MDSFIRFEQVTKIFYPQRSISDVIRGAVFRVPPVIALSDISVRIPQGCIIGLLGPNGAGKTTLLKTIATLLLPDRGSIFVQGHEVGVDDHYIKSLVGFASNDEQGFYGRLTGQQNIEFFARLYNLSGKRIHQRVVELTALLNIDYADRRFDTYSTGMKRKYALMRALMHDPAILLLDEPTKSLDYTAAAELRALMKQYSSTGKTIVCAMHTLEEAETLCDLFLMIYRGRIIGWGTKEALQKQAGDAALKTLVDLYIKLIPSKKKP